MGISNDKLAALGQLFNQAGTMYAQPGSSMDNFNNRMHDSFTTQQMQAELERQKKEEEKKKKSKLFGSVGSTLGTIAGLALAPVTGGASIPLAMAAGGLGGAIGGTAGSMIGGGGFDAGQTLGYGVQGAMGGLGAGMFAPAASGAAGAVAPVAKEAAVGMAPQTFGASASKGSQAMFNAVTEGVKSAAPATSKLFSGFSMKNPLLQGYLTSNVPFLAYDAMDKMGIGGGAMYGITSAFRPTQDGYYLERRTPNYLYGNTGY